MRLSIIFSTIALLSQASLADTYKFDCGKSFNIPQTVSVKPKAPGHDGYTLKATFITSGTDDRTGIIVKKTYNMVGQTDLSSELTGTEISVIALLDAKDSNHQLVIEKTNVIGKAVIAKEYSPDDAPPTRLQCKLVEYSN